MKFKSTTLNPRALVYKRFISLEQSLNTNTLYKTADNLFWAFNADTLTFIPIESNLVPELSKIVIVTNGSYLQLYRQYQSKLFYFWYEIDAENGNSWKSTDDGTPVGTTLLSTTFNNIAKYQMNKYYYVGSIDYVVKGSIEGTTTQFIKGNIIPLTSLNIKYFNDDIKLNPDDLVVIDKHLFSVENVEDVNKRQPKKFSIHFATLNSIL